jgi:hypothetical protein
MDRAFSGISSLAELLRNSLTKSVLARSFTRYQRRFSATVEAAQLATLSKQENLAKTLQDAHLKRVSTRSFESHQRRFNATIEAERATYELLREGKLGVASVAICARLL